jgi:hypothetical protein
MKCWKNFISDLLKNRKFEKKIVGAEMSIKNQESWQPCLKCQQNIKLFNLTPNQNFITTLLNIKSFKPFKPSISWPPTKTYFKYNQLQPQQK